MCSFRKELQQKIQTDNCSPCQISDEIEKENNLSKKVVLKTEKKKTVFEESSTDFNIKQIYNYRLNNDSNSLDPYRKYFVLLWNKKKILKALQMKASHSFEKLHFVWPENLDFVQGTLLYKVSIK